jgi:hypothetical protein
MASDTEKQMTERVREAFAARKANERRMARINRAHVELGIAAYPEFDLRGQLRNILSDYTREKAVAILEQAEKLGREEAEKRSRKASPPTEDRTPIPDRAWKVAADRYRKNRGSNGV